MDGLRPLPQTRTLADITAEHLRDAILQGTIAPATRLVEAEIARALGVSRGPVREALATLVGEGLVRSEGRGRLVATPFSAADIRAIYELRSALESEAARLVATERAPASIDALQTRLGQLREAAAANDKEAFAVIDYSLHEDICTLSGNGRLRRVWAEQMGMIQSFARMEVRELYRSLDGLMETHEELLRAIAEDDPGAAAEVARQHTMDALGQIMRLARPAAGTPSTSSASRPSQPGSQESRGEALQAAKTE